jgi:uncharacterized membrane protein
MRNNVIVMILLITFILIASMFFVSINSSLNKMTAQAVNDKYDVDKYLGQEELEEQYNMSSDTNESKQHTDN